MTINAYYFLMYLINRCDIDQSTKSKLIKTNTSAMHLMFLDTHHAI